MSTKFGSTPMDVVCPSCGVTMTTKLSSRIPGSTHLCACILCIIFFPCVWLPYCISNDLIDHKCSACGVTLGTYTPPKPETRSNHPTSFNDNSGFNDNFNHFSIHSDHSTHHSDSGTRIDHDTSYSHGGDTGYSGGGDCGGGGDSGGGGGSCD